jgi:hypothetical protein
MRILFSAEASGPLHVMVFLKRSIHRQLFLTDRQPIIVTLEIPADLAVVPDLAEFLEEAGLAGGADLAVVGNSLNFNRYKR